MELFIYFNIVYGTQLLTFMWPIATLLLRRATISHKYRPKYYSKIEETKFLIDRIVSFFMAPPFRSGIPIGNG